MKEQNRTHKQRKAKNRKPRTNAIEKSPEILSDIQFGLMKLLVCFIQILHHKIKLESGKAFQRNSAELTDFIHPAAMTPTLKRQIADHTVAGELVS